MTLSTKDILDFIGTYGLPLTMLLAILISGARRIWYFASAVQDLVAQYEKRIEEKNEQIKQLWAVNGMDAKTAEEALAVARQTKEVIEKIDDTLRQRDRPGHEPRERRS